MNINIPTADDTGETLNARIGYYLHHGGKEYQQNSHAYINMTGSKDPIHDGICDWFNIQLHNDNFTVVNYTTNEVDNVRMEFVFSDYSVVITKGSSLKINGETMTKKNICHVLARLLYASVNDKDRSSIRDRFFQLMSLPNNVSYALENKVPFHWYKAGSKIEVRLNINLISEEEAAIEISDGVWGAMSIKELDVFLNYFIHNQKRSAKWTYASPKTLFTATMGRDATEPEYELMLAFLEQNRTSKLVEARARQLLDDMLVQYSDRMILVEQPSGHDEETNRIHIRVRGMEYDWLLVENYSKGNSRQKVNTFRWESSVSNNEHGNFLNGRWNGPICIDNLATGSSLGDQFASRILALLNDKLTMARVSTLRHDYHEVDCDVLPLSVVTVNPNYTLSNQLTKLCSICSNFVTTTEDYDSGTHISCLTDTKGLVA